MIREFRLSPPGSGCGVSCNESGAFVGTVPLLRKFEANGHARWAPRDQAHLSKRLGRAFGIPIDMASKTRGLKAICNALNDGDVARAQVATVLLGIPDSPPLVKGRRSHDAMVKFIRDLHWSGLIKADWDPDEHPRWPAGTPDSQGGRFAPKETSAQLATPSDAPTRVTSADDQIGNERGADRTGALRSAARKPSRNLEQECLRQYDEDTYTCNSLRDKTEAAICHSSAAQRYANCLSGRQIPPLTLPNPENRVQPVPARRPPRPAPPSPPWWLPFMIRPLPLIPIPA